MLKKIKTIIGSQLRKGKPSDQHPLFADEPRIYNAGQHTISPNKISTGAKTVVEELNTAGYDAYLVGGCIRDILLDAHPKDFDVATNATPEQVKQLFKRSRIVGRRFQIVHVRMGREVIEVTTFRANHQEGAKNPKLNRDKSQRSKKGLLLRDNMFGSINEDASRRDFTINALYYQPIHNQLIDFAEGLNAIKHRSVCIIGNPKLRYREDPVRMLRAVRFAAKLEFDIEENTAAPISKMSELLVDIPPARLFDEALKLFMNGYSETTFHLLNQYQLFGKLFPDTNRSLHEDAEPWMQPFIEQALKNTDYRIRNSKGVTPAFLFAALLWPAQKQRFDFYLKSGDAPIYAMQRAAAETIARQCQHISIPKRFTIPMREIWDMQLRLPKRRGKQAYKLLEQRRFRAAYDFLLLREDSSEVKKGLGDWWTRFQAVDEAEKNEMIATFNKTDNSKHSRGRRRKKKPPSDTPTPPQHD